MHQLDKQDKGIFPDVASIMLDAEARKVHYIVDFDEKVFTEKVGPDGFKALKEHKINVKILATNKGKIYAIYADPIRTSHAIESKILSVPTDTCGNAELEVLTLNMLYKKNF